MRVFNTNLICFLAIIGSFLPAESSITLFEKEQPEVKKIEKKVRKARSSEPSNLPLYLRGKLSKNPSEGGQILVAKTNSHKIPNWIYPGKIFNGKILHSVLAFPDERVPVVALLTNYSSRLLGLAKLERNSKKIFIEFSSITISGVTYPISATALTDLGSPGFFGKYYSKEFSLFGADFISSFVAAYFEGLKPKTTNLLGQEINTNSVDSAVKNGLSEGALSSSERFKEKLKKVPEFSELLGPRPIKILIQNNSTDIK